MNAETEYSVITDIDDISGTSEIIRLTSNLIPTPISGTFVFSDLKKHTVAELKSLYPNSIIISVGCEDKDCDYSISYPIRVKDVISALTSTHNKNGVSHLRDNYSETIINDNQPTLKETTDAVSTPISIQAENESKADINTDFMFTYTYNYNPDSRTLSSYNGKDKIVFTRREGQVFNILYSNIGNIVTREKIISSVWGDNNNKKSNVCDVYISMIRDKCAHIIGEGNLTYVHGSGYILRR